MSEETYDYYEDNMSREEYQEAFNEWMLMYEYVEYIEFSDENWEKVQKMDTRLIWTDHGTCENPMVTSGARLYGGRCCWDTYGWYVMKHPWWGEEEDTYISVESGAYLPCPICNRDAEDENINPDCEECEGDGHVNYFFD